jgi:outer membrane protein assembly factor BamD (BamD/ComL family)
MKNTLIVAVFLCSAALLGAQATGLLAGVTAVESGDYPAAITALRAVVADPGQAAVHGDAYLLLAKAEIASGRLKEATATLEHYLLTFPKHRSYAEGVYLKGRLLYLQGEFENAIIALEQFRKTYPDSLFVPNATYWSGESLFALGNLDEALATMRAVVKQWPDSPRAEAAGYRASLIELHKREAELLKLLKASHQETLKTIEDYQRRERMHEQAVAAYQRRLASDGADSDKEVVRLEQALAERERELARLRAQLDALARQGAAQPAAAATSPPPAPGQSAQAARLLEAKARALDLKSRLMRRLGGEGK